MLVNSSTGHPSTVTVEAKGKSVIHLDPVTGEISQIPVESGNKSVSFQVELPPVGSAFYFISEKSSSQPSAKPKGNDGNPLPPKDELVVSAEQENVLVLNYLDLSSGGLELKDTYFMDALLALFDHHGVEMGNPWQHKIQFRQDYVSLDTFPEGKGFSASYHFTVAPKTDITLLQEVQAVAEGHELWDLYINGQKVESEEDSYWIDHDFHFYPVGKYIRSGKNTITLQAPRMSIYAELMPIYLTGSFLLHPLDQGFEITTGTLDSPGSWKDLGYPFYGQKVSYSLSFEVADADREYAVQLNEWQGTTAEVHVNGEKAGQICWPPYRLDVSHLVKEGDNKIVIKVVGSLKNTFGHFYKGQSSWISGPWDWNLSPETIPALDHYFLMDYGLMEPFELLMY
jgi:hypothetical protein